ELGIPFKLKVLVYRNNEAKRADALGLNLHRRHLTAAQKREVIARELKAYPERSDRSVAAVVKADNKTVAAVRSELERREEIPHTPKRTDRTGRKQVAKRSKTKSSTSSSEENLREPESVSPTDASPMQADVVVLGPAAILSAAHQADFAAVCLRRMF